MCKEEEIVIQYADTIQAVHSGEDFQAAAKSVLGFKQESKKGKTVEVLPVTGVATPTLQARVQAVLRSMVSTMYSNKSKCTSVVSSLNSASALVTLHPCRSMEQTSELL